MNLQIAELNESKVPTLPHRNELGVDHYQHNGNIKNISLYCDGNERKLETIEDEDKNVNIEVDSKACESEIISQEDNTRKDDTGETNKSETDEYEHSLWKWPSGRSYLTKVCTVHKTYILYKSNIST